MRTHREGERGREKETHIYSSFMIFESIFKSISMTKHIKPHRTLWIIFNDRMGEKEEWTYTIYWLLSRLQMHNNDNNNNNNTLHKITHTEEEAIIFIRGFFSGLTLWHVPNRKCILFVSDILANGLIYNKIYAFLPERERQTHTENT